jgi:16S rRNA (cytosine1402-N4)-methyltransferase
MSSNAHVPVLLEPVLTGLDIKAGGCYVDGTFGRGGHSKAILDRLDAAGRLLAFDRDPQAIAAAPAGLTDDPRFELTRSDYAELARHIDQRRLTGRVDGILLDLGVSSPQLDEAGRGFSFLRDGPLDMRMDPDAGVPASRWLRDVGEKELKRVLRQYGEETLAAGALRAPDRNDRATRRYCGGDDPGTRT